MSARPPKYDWPIKWPNREAMTKDRLGLILFVVTLATVIPALWVIISFYGALFSGDDEAIRNIGLIFLAVLGAPFVIWRAVVAQGNLDRSKDRDYADLFTKAVEQLGATREVIEYEGEGEKRIEKKVLKSNIEVRIGAIYALERISQDSARDHIAVMETLCAYVRENAPADKCFPHPDDMSQPTDKERHEYNDWVIGDEFGRCNSKSPKVDIQAILDVIFRRSEARRSYEAIKNFRLDLRHSDLIGAELAGLDLSSSILFSARLEASDCEGAIFENAELKFAKLNGALLKNVNFKNTDLRGANFDKSEIYGALLHEASNVSINTISRAYGNKSTKLPNCLEKDRPSCWQDDG